MRIVSISAQMHPYDRANDLYQQYYRTALRAACVAGSIEYKETLTGFTNVLLRGLRTFKHSYKLRQVVGERAQTRTVDRLASVLDASANRASTPIGIYDIQTDAGRSFSISIDAHDGGSTSTEVLQHTDVYFKTNYWPTRTYALNVSPLPNLNPLVGKDIGYFRKLRTVPKSLDLFAFFRIWGGDDEVSGIQHNLALIESLARVPCKKFLCAYLVAGDVAGIGRRLEMQGIQWTTKPMPPKELWRQAAGARLNIVRLGMHECIPWRMTDILSMGGCPVIDYGPRTVWPVPLINREHYLDLSIWPDSTPPHDISHRIVTWLDDPHLVPSIWHNTATYFDKHLLPEPLGASIIAGIEATLTASSNGPDDNSLGALKPSCCWLASTRDYLSSCNCP